MSSTSKQLSVHQVLNCRRAQICGAVLSKNRYAQTSGYLKTISIQMYKIFQHYTKACCMRKTVENFFSELLEREPQPTGLG